MRGLAPRKVICRCWSGPIFEGGQELFYFFPFCRQSDWSDPADREPRAIPEGAMAFSNPRWGSARIREQKLSLGNFPNLEFRAQFDFGDAHVWPHGYLELLLRIAQGKFGHSSGSNRGICTILRSSSLRPHLVQCLIERLSSIGKRPLSGLGRTSGGNGGNGRGIRASLSLIGHIQRSRVIDHGGKDQASGKDHGEPIEPNLLVCTLRHASFLLPAVVLLLSGEY